MEKKAIVFDKTRLIFILFLVCMGGIYIYLAQYHFIWKDEAYSLLTTSQGIKYAFYKAIHMENQPPLYFLILTAWRYISSSIFFSRLLSVIFILVTIVYFYSFSRRRFRNIPPLVSSIIFGVHPFLAWAALEIRPYSLIILVSLVLYDLFYEIFITGNDKIKNVLLFICFSVISVLIQYYLAFLLFSFVFYFFHRRQWKAMKNYVLYMIPAVVVLAALFSYILLHYESHAGNISPVFSIRDTLYFIYKRVELYYLPVIDTTENSWIRWGARLIFVVFAGLIVLKKKKKQRISSSFTFTVISSLCLLIIYSFLYIIVSKYFVEPRHTSSLFVV
ncbi:MAG: glycosyltransferase family 39 protein, partial [Bacteroidota bacterium]